MKKILFCTILTSICFISYAQTNPINDDDILKMLDSTMSTNSTIDYTYATFKGTRVVNGHSIETQGKHVLQFMISHRFGALNSGVYNLFGLDAATMRLGLEYGITNRLTVGIGRATLKKTYDSFLKFKLIRQSKGAKNNPLSVTLFASSTAYSLSDPSTGFDFTNRLVHTLQAIIARKFNDKFSMQISPTLIHRNLVDTRSNQNDVFAIGISGRQKLTKRISLNAEYFYLIPGYTATNFSNCLSIGFDIETGGHVFQLHITNAQGMTENYFIAENKSSWKNGDIYFGFNISRVFMENLSISNYILSLLLINNSCKRSSEK